MFSFKHAAVEAEYHRWLMSAEAQTICADGMTISDVLAVHFLIVDMFYGQSEGLGGIGPKDMGLLSSAVGRQHSGFGDFQKWNSVEEKAATLLYGIVLNHPFHDANKRTAF